jgi:hypothetical protein
MMTNKNLDRLSEITWHVLMLEFAALLIVLWLIS